MIWRPVMADKVSLGEIRRGEVDLEDLMTLNQLLDAQQAAEAAAMKKDA